MEVKNMFCITQKKVFFPWCFSSLFYVRTCTTFSVKEPHAYSKSPCFSSPVSRSCFTQRSSSSSASERRGCWALTYAKAPKTGISGVGTWSQPWALGHIAASPWLCGAGVVFLLLSSSKAVQKENVVALSAWRDNHKKIIFASLRTYLHVYPLLLMLAQKFFII